MKKNIKIYTTVMCPVCGMARAFLSDMNVEFKEINVDFHPIEMIKLFKETRRFSVPQININGKWIYGFDPVRILEALNAAGK